MLIPFAGHHINPSQITRVLHIPGQRLTVVMSDGGSLEVKGATADEDFARINPTNVTLMGGKPGTVIMGKDMTPEQEAMIDFQKTVRGKPLTPSVAIMYDTSGHISPEQAERHNANADRLRKRGRK